VCVCVCGVVQVRLSQEHDRQSSEVQLMTDKHTILTQKKLRVESEISALAADTTDVERDIHRLRIDLLRLNALRHKEIGNETNLERDNLLLQNQFMAELKVTATTHLLLLLLPPPLYRQLYRTTCVKADTHYP